MVLLASHFLFSFPVRRDYLLFAVYLLVFWIQILGMVSFDYSHNLTDRVDSVFSNLVLVSIPQRSTFYNKLDNLAVQ